MFLPGEKIPQKEIFIITSPVSHSPVLLAVIAKSEYSLFPHWSRISIYPKLSMTDGLNEFTKFRKFILVETTPTRLLNNFKFPINF